MLETRSSRLEPVPSTNSVSKHLDESKTSVWMIKSDLHNGNTPGDITIDIVKLRHPRSGAGTMFLFSSDNSILHEIFVFSEKRSWFINDSVRENGNLQISTPVDPLFLILPYLIRSKKEGKIVPLEDLVIDNQFPETSKLLQISGMKNMHMIADQKGPKDLNAWMYNEEKTLEWLTKKTEKVVKVLKEKQINVRGSATSKNYIKRSKQEFSELDEELYLKYAYGLLSEYLMEDLSKKLSFHLKIPESPEKKSILKRKSSQSAVQEIKRIKTEEKEEEENLVKPEKPKVLTAKEKAIIKAASGSKSITMFFKKK